MEMTQAQKDNLDFFNSQLPTLLKDKLLAGKFAVIHSKQLQHASDTFDNALTYAVAHFPNTEFIIQQVVDESSNISYLFCAG